MKKPSCFSPINKDQKQAGLDRFPMGKRSLSGPMVVVAKVHLQALASEINGPMPEVTVESHTTRFPIT